MAEQLYVARVPLLMAQGPGKVPGVIRFAPGEIFSLDGDEGFNAQLALSLGQIKKYDPDAPRPTILKPAKPKAGRRVKSG